jgi:SAM-dependent methyltransferase
MSANDDTKQAVQAYIEAYKVLSPLLSAVQLLGLVRGTYTAGILAQARTPVTPAQLARVVQIEESRAAELCTALDAFGVFVCENDAYRLAEPWAVLTGPDAVQRFDELIDKAFAQAQILQVSANGNQDYRMLSSSDRMAIAKGITFDPALPLGAKIYRLMFGSIPELATMLEAGCRFLVLGAGVAGSTLNTLRAYPRTTAVAVEIAPDLIQEARQRATALGVSNRVTFWQGDARDFTSTELFDLVTWAQFFFPADTRSAVLQTAFKVLKPGGFIMATVQGDPALLDEKLHTEAGQGLALSRVIYGGWGVPMMSPKDLEQEFTSAGFEDAHVAAAPMGTLFLARRPL